VACAVYPPQTKTSTFGFSPSHAVVSVTAETAPVRAFHLDSFSVSGTVRGARLTNGEAGAGLAGVEVGVTELRRPGPCVCLVCGGGVGGGGGGSGGGRAPISMGPSRRPSRCQWSRASGVDLALHVGRCW
jgi:hypothetical protein